MAVPDLSFPSAYGDAFADVYDEWYSTLTDDDFVTAVSRRLPVTSSRILELGVGTGRLIRKLSLKRSPMIDTYVGTDASEKMLNVARDNGISEIAELECSDFSRQLPPGPFDAVFVGYNTLFNLANENAIASCLDLVAQVLAPSGFFMCDLVIPHGDETEEFSEIRTMANGDVVTSTSRHDPQSRQISGSFIQHGANGDTVTRPWTVHYVLPHQLDSLAERAGLRLIERTENGNGEAFTPDSSRHISTYVLR